MSGTLVGIGVTCLLFFSCVKVLLNRSSTDKKRRNLRDKQEASQKSNYLAKNQQCDIEKWLVRIKQATYATDVMSILSEVDDDKTLIAIAKTERRAYVGMDAARRVKTTSALVDIAMSNDVLREVRVAAIRHITDDSALTAIAESEDIPSFIRTTALQKRTGTLTEQTLSSPAKPRDMKSSIEVKEMLRDAIQKNEFRDFLEGKGEYRIGDSQWELPVPTDIGRVLSQGIYVLYSNQPEYRIQERLEDELHGMLDEDAPDIYVAFHYIFIQRMNEWEHKSPIVLDSRVLEHLGTSLATHKDRLMRYYQWTHPSKENGALDTIAQTNNNMNKETGQYLVDPNILSVLERDDYSAAMNSKHSQWARMNAAKHDVIFNSPANSTDFWGLSDESPLCPSIFFDKRERVYFTYTIYTGYDSHDDRPQVTYTAWPKKRLLEHLGGCRERFYAKFPKLPTKEEQKWASNEKMYTVFHDAVVELEQYSGVEKNGLIFQLDVSKYIPIFLVMRHECYEITVFDINGEYWRRVCATPGQTFKHSGSYNGFDCIVIPYKIFEKISAADLEALC